MGWVLPPIPPSTAPPYVPPSAPPIPLEGFEDLPPPTYEQAISADEGNVIQTIFRKLFLDYFMHH